LVVYVNCKQISAGALSIKKWRPYIRKVTAAKAETNVIIKMGIKITNDKSAKVERGWIGDSLGRIY